MAALRSCSWLLVLSLPLAAACTPGGVVTPTLDAGPDAGSVEDAGALDAGRDGGADAGAIDCTVAGACAQGACAGRACDSSGGICGGGVCVPATPSTETVCDDLLDDDDDGLTDCQDPDCACGPQVEIRDVQSVRSFGGSSGPSMAEAACPLGQVVVGFAGAEAEFLDRIQPICAPIFTEDFLTDVIQIRTGAGSVVSLPGGPAGTPFEDRCPDDMVVTRVNVRSGEWVDSLTARCEALFADRSSGTWVIYGDGQAVLPVRGGGGGSAEEITCVDGAFTRLHVQYGQYVDRFTVECRDFAIVEP